MTKLLKSKNSLGLKALYTEVPMATSLKVTLANFMRHTWSIYNKKKKRKRRIKECKWKRESSSLKTASWGTWVVRLVKHLQLRS